MKKSVLKYWIDAVLFINVCSIAAIGLLLGFVIPRGRAASNYFLWLHRHEWGEIHLALSIFLLIFLTLHIWLNWSWIVQSTKRWFGSNWKNALGCFSAAWIVVLLIAWILSIY